jgi:hypothetical protein
MRKVIIFSLLALVVSSCCSTSFLILNKEKCDCKEFEQYIRSWKIDEQRNTLYIDRKDEDLESWKYLEEHFLFRLHCLKGKTFGYAKKLFRLKPSETNIKIPTSQKCLDCYLNRNDCRNDTFARNSCKPKCLDIAFGRENEAIIREVGSDLQLIGYMIYLSK